MKKIVKTCFGWKTMAFNSFLRRNFFVQCMDKVLTSENKSSKFSSCLAYKFVMIEGYGDVHFCLQSLHEKIKVNFFEQKHVQWNCLTLRILKISCLSRTDNFEGHRACSYLARGNCGSMNAFEVEWNDFSFFWRDFSFPSSEHLLIGWKMEKKWGEQSFPREMSKFWYVLSDHRFRFSSHKDSLFENWSKIMLYFVEDEISTSKASLSVC